MLAEITHRGRTFRVDLSRPLDLSLPLREGDEGARAWYVGPVTMEPVGGADIARTVLNDGAARD